MTAALREPYVAGATAHGALALPFEVFAARVAAHAARRRARHPEAAADAPPRLVGADLYLACACDTGVAGAWERFQALYRVRLVGLGRARGLPPAAAGDLVDDLLQDLALPAPGGSARTLLGTFEGTGSLFGWLAAVLVRRILRAGRRPVAGVDAEGPRAQAARADEGPLEATLDAESRRRFARALEDAWGRLTRNERIAVVAAHRHGLLHREIGALLGVGRPRVTRLLAAGIRRIRDAVLPALGDGDESRSQAEWRALASAVASHLARMAPAGPSTPLPEDVRGSGRTDHRSA